MQNYINFNRLNCQVGKTDEFSKKKTKGFFVEMFVERGNAMRNTLTEL